jgi:hypothetical protein
MCNLSNFTLDNYLITYESNIKFEEFSNEWYYGIIFYIDDFMYQLIHNYAFGNRILTNNHDGWISDIPFKPATFHLLPPGVTAKEL